MAPTRVYAMIMGDNGCGKNRLLHAFTGNHEDYIPITFDTQVKDIEVDGEEVSLILLGKWSNAKDHATCRFIYRDVDVILLCFSIGNRATFDSIPQNWIGFVRNYYPNVPVVLVGNKKDLRTHPTTPQMMSYVTTEEGLSMAESISASGYVECSAMDVHEVRVVFETAVRAVSNSL